MRIKYKDYSHEHKDIILRNARNGKYPCFYCGVPSSSIDHFIPQSHTKNLMSFAEINGIIKEEVNDILMKQKYIPACKECNAVASNGIFNTPDEKKSYVKKRLRERFKKILNTPKWNEEDYKEMDYTLRSYIKGSLSKKDIIQKRIAW